MSDLELARRVRRLESPVKSQRRALNIPRFNPVSWTDEEIKPLGTLPDEELAKQLGRIFDAGKQRRKPPNPPLFSLVWLVSCTGFEERSSLKSKARPIGIIFVRPLLNWFRSAVNPSGWPIPKTP